MSGEGIKCDERQHRNPPCSTRESWLETCTAQTDNDDDDAIQTDRRRAVLNVAKTG